MQTTQDRIYDQPRTHIGKRKDIESVQEKMRVYGDEKDIQDIDESTGPSSECSLSDIGISH